MEFSSSHSYSSSLEDRQKGKKHKKVFSLVLHISTSNDDHHQVVHVLARPYNYINKNSECSQTSAWRKVVANVYIFATLRKNPYRLWGIRF